MNTKTNKAGILLKGKNKKAWTMVLILIGMIILSSILSPSFRSARNLLNILNQNSIYGIMALGMGCVILTGAIDLSAGSTAALAAVIATPLFRDYGFAAGMIGGLCIGVIENQYLMPLNQTRKAVAQAQKLLKAGKYYEANLVLKGAEEGIVVDSEMLVAGN